jgi:hypothetical protein
MEAAARSTFQHGILGGPAIVLIGIGLFPEVSERARLWSIVGALALYAVLLGVIVVA